MSMLKERNVTLTFGQRILKAIEVWKKLIKVPIQHRNQMVRAWLAGYEQAETLGTPHPINLVDRGLGILIPYMVMSNPKVLVSTERLDLRPFAWTTELAFNHLFKEIKFAKNTLRPAVRDSLLGMAIVKTGLATEWQIEAFGHLHDVGQVYADVVDLEDYIGDPSARTFEGFELEGNIYRIPVDIARDLYPKHADHISAQFHLYGEDESLDRITKSDLANEQYNTLKEWTELADIWLPDEGMVVTINPHDSRGKIYRSWEWDGPEGGPFDKLYYKEIPGTPIALPPVWSWLDMDTAINVVVNKIRKQAEAQKTILTYEGESTQDANRIANAADRQAVQVQHRDGVRLFEFPGIDSSAYTWISYLESQYSIQGQNLYTMGGRNVQAGTLGQEQMLLANASKSVDDMVQQFYEFTASIANKISWYFWTDPLIVVPQVKRIEGYGSIEVVFDRAGQEGDFWDYNFDIEPYSMQRLNPHMEYQRLITLLSQWVLPTAQIAAQQGIHIDIPAATAQLAKHLQLRNVGDWFKPAVPMKVHLNPYQPQLGMIKPENGAIQDGRTGLMGAESRIQNLIQQQARAGGQSSTQVG